jgi:hypothetical protein
MSRCVCPKVVRLGCTGKLQCSQGARSDQGGTVIATPIQNGIPQSRFGLHLTRPAGITRSQTILNPAYRPSCGILLVATELALPKRQHYSQQFIPFLFNS